MKPEYFSSPNRFAYRPYCCPILCNLYLIQVYPILILSSTLIKSPAVIYNIALAGSTGVARRNLEAIGELYFNSQNVATQIVFNLSAMSVF